MRSLSALSVLFLLALPACAPLQNIDGGICGNGVIEPTDGANNEDCDSQPLDGFACRAATETSPCSLSCNAAGGCPAGFGCGTDGVCRHARGGFKPDPFAILTSQAQELLSGDFDNDRRADVVAVEPGRIRVHFFGDSGEFRQTSFSAATRPSIAKLGGLPSPPGSSGGVPAATDTTDDLVFPLNLGVGALLSRGDQTFAAKTYGSVTFERTKTLDGKMADIVDALIMGVNAIPTLENSTEFTGDETAALLAYRKDGEAAEFADGYFVDFSTGGGGLIFPVPGTTPKSLLGPPVKANFNADPCEEIVFPTKALKEGTSTLVVYRTCTQDFLTKNYQWLRTLDPETAVMAKIDLGAELKGPVFAFDVNKDGKLDLLITTACAAGEDGCLRLRVAYNVGNGRFSSVDPPPVHPADYGDNQTAPYASMVDSDSHSGVPLALGDLDADGLPDIVDSSQVYLGVPAASDPIFFKSVYKSSRSWTEAALADVNGNGRLDVIASAAGGRDIDILSSNDSSYFNPSQLSTDGKVSLLTIGDFDGDLISDVAFQDALLQGETLVMIAYGRASGGIEEPVEVGRFLSVQQMGAGNVHSFGKDNISDLGVVSGTDDGKLAFSIFPGTATRFLQAPFLLSTKETSIQVPLQTALGILDRGDLDPNEQLHNDLAVVAFRPPKLDLKAQDPTVFTDNLVKLSSSMRLWGLFGAGDAGFTTSDTALCEIPLGATPLTGLEQATSVTVSSARPGEPGSVFVSSPVMILNEGPVPISLGAMLFEAHFHGADPCTFGATFSAAPGEQFFRLTTAELNGKGRPEILALKKKFKTADLLARFSPDLAPEGNSMGEAETSQLVIFWDGRLDAPPYEPPGELGLVTDYAVGDLDGDGLPEILVASTSGLHVFRRGDSDVTLDGEDLKNFQVVGVTAVHLADVDGDGVQDLITVSNGLRFFHGIARGEPEAGDVAVGN
jgi:hypothetical protein